MKKIIKVAIAAGVIIGAGVGGFYCLNGMVEKDLNNSIKNINESGLADISGDVSVNVILGTLKIKDLKIKSGESVQEGDVKVKGLNFLDKKNLFSNEVSIYFDNYRSEYSTNYYSDNSFVVSKEGESKINIKAVSSFVGEENQGKLKQEYAVNISDVNGLYDTLTKDVSQLIVNDASLNPMLYIGQMSNAKVDKFVLTIKNDDFIKKALREAAKQDGASAEDVDKYIVEQIKEMVPLNNQESVLSFYNSDKSSLILTFTNKSKKPLMSIYSEMFNHGNSTTAISNNYDIESQNIPGA